MKEKIRHRTHRRKKVSHPEQLIQIDATPYECLDVKTKYALYGAIDDVTDKISRSEF